MTGVCGRKVHHGLPAADFQGSGLQVRSMRRWCIVLTCAVLLGCSTDPVTAPLQADWERPRFLVDDSCTFGILYCARLRGGIDYLWGSSDAICRGYGALANDRYNAVDHGYRNGAYPSQPWWYTRMQPDPAFPSGWGPSDGDVNINAAAWNGTSTPCSTAGVIAHEEVHQQGWDDPTHSTGEANGIQQRCGCGT